jgi:hypothetical protein
MTLALMAATQSPIAAFSSASEKNRQLRSFASTKRSTIWTNGFENYLRMARSPLFAITIYNTTLFTIFSLSAAASRYPQGGFFPPIKRGPDPDFAPLHFATHLYAALVHRVWGRSRARRAK